MRDRAGSARRETVSFAQELSRAVAQVRTGIARARPEITGRNRPGGEWSGDTVAKTTIEIFDHAVVTGHNLSRELLAEMVHPDPSGDMKEVRRACAAHCDALAELTGELQMMRN